MASRSTRNKIRWQVKKAIDDVDSMLGHLQFLDELAGGQSDYINKNLPGLVTMIDGVREVLVQFRDGC